MYKMSRFFYQPALGLFIIRIVVGAIFIHHGWTKFGNPGIAQFFVSLGLASWMTYVVATVEVLGGAMLLLGVLTRPAAVALAIVALFAAILAKMPKGLEQIGQAEFELLLFGAALGLAFIGAGKYRLTHLFEHDVEVIQETIVIAEE